MSRFASYDGTEIAFRARGAGPPLVCLPGGPGRGCDYLGDLGGLAGSRQLIMPDARGTGASGTADPATYRCDRLVEDVEALRAHLGLETIDLLGHSAGGALAELYAAAYPQRVDHLVLLTADLQALGIEPSEDEERAALQRRSAEPWYAAAMVAVDKMLAGDYSAENRRDFMPFLYSRWDAAAQAHSRLGVSERTAAFRAAYYAAGAYDAEAVRSALGKLAAPVLIYAGEIDVGPTTEQVMETAGLFPHCEVVVQPGAAHYPWLDDPAWFTAAINSFLG